VATVAVYSTADKDSLPVKFADEAVCIGPAPSNQSYLSIPNIIAAAEITNSDAIHPGYGFLAENAKFSKICEEHKIKFIGASAKMIDSVGDKANAIKMMHKAGVPTIPGSNGLVKDIKTMKEIAQKIKYPVMVKASAGGGGKGMRVVRSEEELEEAVEKAKAEAMASFGNDDMYVEKFIEEPRHIEIQIAGDQYGSVSHLSERDCSIQRRHQKLVEEVPSPFMTLKLRERMGKAAIKAGKSVRYEGVGTVEFLVDKKGAFYFMEMNTRIQVEHPITEEVTNYDLVKEQIKIAAGKKISGKNLLPVGHAIECRINAEDPYNNFRPCPGQITNFHKPGGHGVRVDTHVYSGYTIPPHYDSLIAKLICVAQTREEAIAKMTRALEEFILEGIETTKPFHEYLMKSEAFITGKYTTNFLDDFDLSEAEQKIKH